MSTKAIYEFRVIDPRSPIPEIDRARTLGVEITVANRAAECGLGNIDPQHGFEAAPWKRQSYACTAAIDMAQLEGRPPPRGSILSTIRPDLDSIGAMGVLVLREIGIELDEGADSRIRRISSADSFRPGGAWVPRPLPTREQPWPAGAAPVTESEELAPIAWIVANAGIPMSTRVAIVAAWLLWGVHVPLTTDALLSERAEIDVLVSIFEATGGAFFGGTALREQFADAAARVRDERWGLVAAIESGEIAVNTLMEAPQMAYVVSSHRAGLGLGYCLAPFVCARNPAFRWPDGSTTEKWTIASYGDRADFPGWALALADRLNVFEVDARAEALCPRAVSLKDRGDPIEWHRLAPEMKARLIAYVDERVRPHIRHHDAISNATCQIGPRGTAQHACDPGWEECAQVWEAFVDVGHVADVRRSLRTVVEKVTPRWGGPRNLVASPQGEASAIPTNEIFEIVREFAPKS